MIAARTHRKWQSLISQISLLRTGDGGVDFFSKLYKWRQISVFLYQWTDSKRIVVHHLLSTSRNFKFRSNFIGIDDMGDTLYGKHPASLVSKIPVDTRVQLNSKSLI